MSTRYKIGIDVGGTFTDLVAMDAVGQTTICKTLSTPHDQSLGVIEGLGLLAERLGLTAAEMLECTDRIVHGTTVATNALLERKGAKVGLLTTQGHLDVIEMREGLKPERYNLLMAPPEPLVPRDLRRGVPERIGFDGAVMTPLDVAALKQEIAFLAEQQVEAVAICFLHAYRNPQHEQQAADIVRQMMPGVYVSVSSDVLPQIKEYERFSTTTVNAYIGPVVSKYMTRLTGRLSGAGYDGALYIILSHGGIAPVEDAIRLAAGTCLSGPAGGIAGAKCCADILGAQNVIPFDMGGTSTEISLISNGEVALTTERGLAGERIALRSYDILSIGAGGGSIAHLDSVGSFTVGPQSAGAAPGPACYGKGGADATVTDSNLVLGYLDETAFATDTGGLDRAASETAIDALADKLGLDRMTTAQGIHRLINVKMADGIRLMTLRRGVDPRQFTLLSFGGAAGLHAVEVAREIGISRVVVPTVASVLSAWGMLASDLRYEMSRSSVGDRTALEDDGLRALFHVLEEQAKARLPETYSNSSRIERSADMRYGEQIFEIGVSLDGIDIEAPGVSAAVQDRFHRRHEELYTYCSPDQEVDLVNVRVAVVGAVERGAIASPLDDTPKGPLTPMRHTSVYIGGHQTRVPVYAMSDLGPGHSLSGPALVVAETTTVMLHAEDKASVTPHGWLDVALAPSGHHTTVEEMSETQPATAI
ncbi:hydantoinase/oxoprolinase family protein [Roseovarius aestuarii]|nr:hydantoinase/oxoprolinase family protein [Roseovarius aestuarii]